MRRESTVGERSAKHNKPAADELNQTYWLASLHFRYCCWPTLPGWPIFVYGAMQVVGLKWVEK